MRTLVRGATALAFVMFVVSCSGLLKKKEEDAGGVPEASVAVEPATADAEAPAPTPSAALATNEGDVARFPDETKMPDVTATLLRTYNVREAPPAGTVVASLPKGTSVTQIAQRAGNFLVTFDNPKAPGTKLMGWIYRDAFSAVVADAGPLTCPKGEVMLFGDVPFCGKVCGDDSMCPAGQACKGQANKLLPNGKAGDGLTVCTIFHPHDAGVSPSPGPLPIIIFDAGKPATTDASAPAPVVDAGPKPTPPTGADVVPPGAGNSCPAGFLFVDKTKKCHRGCPGGITAQQCNAKSFCIKCDKDNKKVCADTRDQCK